MILDDLLKNIPHLILARVHKTLRGLDVVAEVLLHQLLHDEGLEQLKCHFFGQTALIKFEFRSYDDDGTSGIVHAFAEEVLTESALFAAQQTGKGFQISVAGAADRLASPAVVDERVHRLLEHTFLVADDDVGRAEFLELFKTVVAVDDSAVEVVEVGGGEPAAVQLHHGAQFGRQHGQHVEDHPFGTVAADAERLDDLQSLDGAQSLLAGAVGDDLFKLRAVAFEVDLHEQLFDGFRTHADAEILGPVFFQKVAVLLVRDDLLFGQFRHLAGIQDDERDEIQHLFEILGRDVEQETDPGRHSAEIPDVGDGSGKLDVSHPLAAHLALGDFHAALLADDALVAYPLISSAMAFPIARRSEDLFAEKTVAFGFLSAVIYGLGFRDLAVGPFPDLFGRGDTDLYCIEIAEFVHSDPPYSSSSASSFAPKMSKGLPVVFVSAPKMSSSSAPVSNMLSTLPPSSPNPSKSPSPMRSTSLSSS